VLSLDFVSGGCHNTGYLYYNIMSYKLEHGHMKKTLERTYEPSIAATMEMTSLQVDINSVNFLPTLSKAI